MENINFNDLFTKLKDVVKRVGYATAKHVIQMYLVLTDEKTATTDKIIIYSTLAYIVLPIDILSAHKHPIFGHLDEVAAVVMAYKKIKKYVTPEIERRADEILNSFLKGTDDSTIVN